MSQFGSSLYECHDFDVPQKGGTFALQGLTVLSYSNTKFVNLRETSVSFFCIALDYVTFWSRRRVFGEEGLWACEAPSSPKTLLPCGLKIF